RERHAEGRDREAEDRRHLEGMQIIRITEQPREILEPHEASGEAEGVLDHHRLPERLEGRPDEEYQRHRELWRQQQIRRELVGEDGALRHDPLARRPEETPLPTLPLKGGGGDIRAPSSPLPP